MPDDCEESGSLCNRIDHLLVVATPGWSVRDRRRPSMRVNGTIGFVTRKYWGYENVPRIEGYPEGTTAQWRHRPEPDLIG